jgi:HNH endonuclease
MASAGRRIIRVDRRYNQPFRLTGYGWRVVIKWLLLVMLWASITGGTRNLLIYWAATLALAAYAVHRVRVYWRDRAALPAGATRATAYQAPGGSAPRPLRFNVPPGWPILPGWTPEPGWQPDPAWPPAPADWQFWIPAQQAPLGERNTRTIPQDVKIQVAARDVGRCRQCGSTADLHFDHVIPWSKGGANTVNNIQLLCGPCNRRKGADDIPARL